jgi:hypothetical protein
MREPPICVVGHESQQEFLAAIAASSSSSSPSRDTYVDGNVADDSIVVGQADVAGLVMRGTMAASAVGVGTIAGAAIAKGRRRRVRVDDEGALDVDLDAARAYDGAVNVVGRRHRCHGRSLLDLDLGGLR